MNKKVTSNSMEVFHCKLFFPSKSACRLFCTEITHNPPKVEWSAPKISQTFAHLADSDLSIISKVLKQRGTKLSRGRTYGDVMAKFSRIDRFSFFISYGAPLACAKAPL